jgi:hypothetical protein
MRFVSISFAIAQILAFMGWRQTRFPWVRFAAAQVFQVEATVAGWFVLIPFCLFREWEMSPIPSIKDGRTIDQWTWGPANLVLGNPEDGVSGQTAVVFTTGAAGPYMPGAWAPWRAYCWSALRNSCDSLKYFFALKGGPLIEKPYRLWKWSFAAKFGWQVENGISVPVFSPFERVS